MSRALVLALMVAVLPPQCAKILGKEPAPEDPLIPTAPPPSVPITSATTPPIWHPPDVGTVPTSSSTAAKDPASTDLAKARAAADAKDWKKVKSILEKKIKSGKATADEVSVMKDACTASKDKACLAEIKAKYSGAAEAP